MKPHRQIPLSSLPLPPAPLRPGEGDSILGDGKELVQGRAPTSVLGGFLTSLWEAIGKVEGPRKGLLLVWLCPEAPISLS